MVYGRGVLGRGEGGQGGFVIGGLKAAVLQTIVCLVSLSRGTYVHECHRSAHALPALLATHAPGQHLDALHGAIPFEMFLNSVCVYILG